MSKNYSFYDNKGLITKLEASSKEKAVLKFNGINSSSDDDGVPRICWASTVEDPKTVTCIVSVTQNRKK